MQMNMRKTFKNVVNQSFGDSCVSYSLIKFKLNLYKNLSNSESVLL